MPNHGLQAPSPGPLPAATPSSPAAWLPFFWSRVLFPGPTAAPGRLRGWALLLLLVVPGALLYPCLAFHLFEPDEGRYAEIPREMLLRGEWTVPYLQGEPYLDKPPLLYWMVMGSYRVFGVHDWAARLAPALAIHACVLLTYLLGRRLVGERAAWWGALLLALAPGFIGVGRLLVLDGVLTLWVWLSILAAWEAVRVGRLRWGWWLLTALACGLGGLTKGPVTLVLLLPPLWLSRRLGGGTCRVRWPAWAAFAAVVLAVNLPWYVAVSLRQPTFVRYFFWEHNVVRFLDPFDHLRPIWFYGPILLVGLLPGTLLAGHFLRFLAAGDPDAAGRRSPELGYLLLAGGWCVLFFSLSGCKLPTYILPAFPPLALALGAYAAGSRWQTSRWPAAVAGATFALLAVGHWAAVPWYARHHSPLGRSAALLRECADPAVPVICYPRPADSVAFYLGRDDLKNYRSKQTPALITFLQDRPRTVVLFTHRHSLKALRPVLPPELKITREAPLFGSAKFGPAGDCYLAVIERRRHPPSPRTSPRATGARPQYNRPTEGYAGPAPDVQPGPAPSSSGGPPCPPTLLLGSATP
jgi:4-amino-4-deoxy-L-arabinose transferase-like glycosyltransferase